MQRVLQYLKGELELLNAESDAPPDVLENLKSVLL